MKIQLLEVGRFQVPAGIVRNGASMDERLDLPIPAYLIETATERILVDTGPHPAAVADAVAHYRAEQPLGPYTVTQELSVAEQVDLGTLTKVVMTHLHFDHASGLSLLPPSVTVVMQRREWEAAHDPAGVARNYFLVRDYDHLDERRVTLIDGEHDLLGDGSLTLLPTPGHTPGHQSLRVGERLVIGADVGLFAATLDDLRFPVYADDFEAQSASAAHLRALRDDAGARVLPGHDPDVIRPGPIEL